MLRHRALQRIKLHRGNEEGQKGVSQGRSRHACAGVPTPDLIDSSTGVRQSWEQWQRRHAALRRRAGQGQRHQHQCQSSHVGELLQAAQRRWSSVRESIDIQLQNTPRMVLTRRNPPQVILGLDSFSQELCSVDTG
jgi:hypothetical protein